MAMSPEVYDFIFTKLASKAKRREMSLEDLGPIYVTSAYMGTPQQPITIEFDTGSPAAYIYSK